MGKVSTLSPLVEVRISYKAVYSLVYDNGHFHHAKSLVILGNLALIFQKWSEMLFGEGDVMDNLEVALHKGATITMGTSPKGTTYNHEGIGLPLLNGPTEFGETYPHCTLYTTDSKKECKVDDLIFCVRGSTTGRMNWADQTYSLGRGLCSIRGETLLDTKFIRCCIEWKLNELLNLAGGSTFPNLTKDTIRNFPIPYPKSRHKIAAVLSAYDDLIENNTRRIKILEEMASTIYREWFVEFRFPGHEGVEMVESELGLIPQGWKVGKLGDSIENIKEKIKPGKHLEPMPYVPIDCIPRRSMALTEHKPSSEAKSSLIAFKRNDILFGAMRSYFHKVIFAPFDGITRQTCFVLRSKNSDNYPFDLFTMFQDSTVEYSSNHSTGSTIPYVTWDGALSRMSIVKPSNPLIEQFGSIVRPMLDSMRVFMMKNTNLRQTRDLLLPKLISGEIDVSELDIDTD